MDMTPNRAPGELSPRVVTLVIAACAVTVIVAAAGMQAMWEVADWSQSRMERWGWDGADVWQAPQRSGFWYANGLALWVCALIAVAWRPRFSLPRLLRVAVLLPLIQLVAIVFAARLWLVLDHDMAAWIAHYNYTDVNRPNVVLPDVGVIGVAFAAIVVLGILIKRKQTEWAHATVMIALAFLLLVGLWLPILSRFGIEPKLVGAAGDYQVFEPRYRFAPGTFAQYVVIPPAIAATLFTVFVFRAPRLFARCRLAIRKATIGLLVLAICFALALPDKAWLLYLESTYLVMIGVVLVVLSLALLAAATWLGSLWTQHRLRKRPLVEGTIEDDDHGPIARFEITSALRGPRLVARAFVVTTPAGKLPISGSPLLANVPVGTTTLEVGEHAEVLEPGAKVLVAARTHAADGHPFRANDMTDVALVAAADLRRHRFSDVVLVVWRPAVAYLAILIAVALPGLAIFLTE
jgi:hypothetical protein